jgi:hypothetical protein
MMHEGIPEYGEHFIAVEKGNGHQALNPPFRCIKVDPISVHAQDKAGSQRIFNRSVWCFHPVDGNTE